MAPYSEQYRFANLVCWRRASMQEWKATSRHTQFLPGQIQLDSNAIFRLPILGSSNFPPYVNQIDNLFTCCINPPKLVKTALEDRCREEGKLFRVDEEEIQEELSVVPEDFMTSPADAASVSGYSRRSFTESHISKLKVPSPV